MVPVFLEKSREMVLNFCSLQAMPETKKYDFTSVSSTFYLLRPQVNFNEEMGKFFS
jgi:hypothetical protein